MRSRRSAGAVVTLWILAVNQASSPFSTGSMILKGSFSFGLIIPPLIEGLSCSSSRLLRSSDFSDAFSSELSAGAIICDISVFLWSKVWALIATFR